MNTLILALIAVAPPQPVETIQPGKYDVNWGAVKSTIELKSTGQLRNSWGKKQDKGHWFWNPKTRTLIIVCWPSDQKRETIGLNDIQKYNFEFGSTTLKSGLVEFTRKGR